MSDNPRVGPLTIRNNLSEIAAQGTSAVAAALLNLGIPNGPLALPDATLLGAADGAYVPTTLDASLTLADRVLAVNFGKVANTSVEGNQIGAAGGAASLDGGTLVPLVQIPAIPVARVTGLAPSATTDTTIADHITSGTLATARLAAGAARANLGFAPLNPAANLTDVASVPAAQTALGAGAANGLAQLDGTGHLPAAQAPAGVGYFPFGSWNATTGVATLPNNSTVTLASGVGTPVGGVVGGFFQVQTPGTFTLDSISSWAVGDQVIWSGSLWQKLTPAAAFVPLTNGTAANLSITSGTAAGMTSLGVTDGSAIFSSSTSPHSINLLGADGEIMAYFDNGTGQWTFVVPVTATMFSSASILASLALSIGTAGAMTQGSAPDDLYITGADGEVIAYWSNASVEWVFTTPVSAPSLTVNSLGVQTISPTSVRFLVNSTLDTVIEAVSLASAPNIMIAITGADGEILNYFDSTTGEWNHQSATGIPKALLNAGKLQTRLTHSPIAKNVLTTGTLGTTSHLFTLEGLPAMSRFIFINDLPTGQATVSVSYAFTDTPGNLKDPTLAGAAVAWTTVTWLNAGLPKEYGTQIAALQAANFSAPTSFTLLPGALAAPVYSLSDWMITNAPPRIDGGLGATMLLVRVNTSAGTPRYVVTSGDISGAWDPDLQGRTMCSIFQAGVDGVGSPSSFTNTTRTGTFICLGAQYESLARGVTTGIFGDSTVAGFGSNGGIQNAWRQMALGLSTPALPIETANFATVGSTTLYYLSQGVSVLSWVHPSWVHVLPWSRNNWAEKNYGGATFSIQVGIGGTITIGDVFTLTVTDVGVLGSPVPLAYTVQAGDTPPKVAAALVALANANSTLTTALFSAVQNGTWCNIITPDGNATGAVTLSGSATITGVVYNGYEIFTQAAADQGLGFALAIADAAQAIGAVFSISTSYGNIAMTPQTDVNRVNTNARIMDMDGYVLLDFDEALSVPGAGLGGIPLITKSADGVHPNGVGYAVEAALIQPQFKAAYGL